MTVSEFNKEIRQIVEEKMKDYKKSNITAILLGASSGQQMENFLKGKDFGFKPLSRIVDAFDCELHISVVPKNDEETKAKIDKINNDFITKFDFLLGETLENVANDSTIKRGRPKSNSKIEKFIEEETDNLIEKLLNN